MKYETKITVNKDACLTEKRLREQILISDPLSFCPAAGMVISISFSDIMNRFNIEINCVNSDIAESAIAHNDWLQVKKKNQFTNIDGESTDIYFDIFNHRCFIFFESEKDVVRYGGKQVYTTEKNKMGENKHHYYIYMSRRNPFNTISKVKKAKKYVETWKYVQYLQGLGYKIYRKEDLSNGYAIFPSYNFPHYIVLDIWEAYIGKNSVEEQYEHETKKSIYRPTSDDYEGESIYSENMFGSRNPGNIKIEDNNIILCFKYREPLIVELIRSDIKSARGF